MRLQTIGKQVQQGVIRLLIRLARRTLETIIEEVCSDLFRALTQAGMPRALVSRIVQYTDNQLRKQLGLK